MIPIPPDAQHPDGPPPQGEKRRVETAFVPDEPREDGGAEVGGRDARWMNGRLVYPTFWHTGVYVWCGDGDVYRGPHWHPNGRSPVACDLDDEM
jgi:hypothetical protein